MLKPTKILVPTDFSAHSDKALREALDLASEYGAEVYLLHVMEEKIGSAFQTDYPDISITPATIKRRQNKLVRMATGRLKKQLERVPPEAGVKTVCEVIPGVPYNAILRFQVENGIDLIVISSLGSTGLARFFIGGVARNVLKGSTCPVLLTKAVD
jgi:universal stress protein A